MKLMQALMILTSRGCVLVFPLYLHKDPLSMSPSWQQVAVETQQCLCQWLILLFISICICGLLISSWHGLVWEKTAVCFPSSGLPVAVHRCVEFAFVFLGCKYHWLGRCTLEIWLCRKNAVTTCVKCWRTVYDAVFDNVAINLFCFCLPYILHTNQFSAWVITAILMNIG